MNEGDSLPLDEAYLASPESYTEGHVLMDDKDLRIVHVRDPSGGGFNVEVFVKDLRNHRRFPLVVQWYGGKPQCFLWGKLSSTGGLTNVAQRFPHSVDLMPDGSYRARVLHWYY
jgi:hypothetical protein